MSSLIRVSNWTLHVSQYTWPWTWKKVSPPLARAEPAKAKTHRAEIVRAIVALAIFFFFFLFGSTSLWSVGIYLRCENALFYKGERMREKDVKKVVIFVWSIFRFCWFLYEQKTRSLTLFFFLLFFKLRGIGLPIIKAVLSPTLVGKFSKKEQWFC